MAKTMKRGVIYNLNTITQKEDIVRLNIALLFVLSILVFLLTAMHANFFLPKSISVKNFVMGQSRTRVLAESSTKDFPESPTPIPTPTITPTPTIVPTEVPADASGDFCLQVPVLFYHHIEAYNMAEQEGHASLTVDSEAFAGQMDYLNTHGYHSISAEDLAHALIDHQQLPPKSVIVTMDDGYIDIYTYAYPILKKYNIIGNVMIPAGLIEKYDYMTWKQLQEMVKSPVIKVYNHSYSHADLSDASEETLQAEVVAPNKELEEKLGSKIDIFTYPYGSFNDNTIDFLKHHGFIAAFSTLPGSLQCESQILKLPRTRIGNAPLSEYGF